MANENKILSNLKYGFVNQSNYEVSKEEIDAGIWEVPYFPAQNLITTEPINIYTNKNNQNPNETHIYFPDGINNRLYRIFNGKDLSQRLLFMVFDQNSRHVEYRFSGTVYPSGRNDFAYTYDGIRYLYIAGGEANGRCKNDIWKFDIQNNVWEPIIGQEDISSNFIPGRRKKASILKTLGKIYIAGGEVDSEIGDVYITLNDVWEYDEATNRWTKYDNRAQLPRTKLNLIYADNDKIIILADNKNLYQITKANDSVSLLTSLTSPLNVEASFYLNNEFIVSVRNTTTGNLDWYKYDSTNNTFNLYKENALAIDDNQNYWIENYRNTRYGEIDIAPTITVFEPKLKSGTDDSDIKICSIKPIPNLEFMNYTMIPNNKIFFFSGFINGQLAENTWIFNGQTLNIDWMVDTATANTMVKPNERYAAALCYDNWHNRVWLFGGYDGSTYYNDLWYFDLDTNQWIKVQDNISLGDNQTVPAPRANMDIEFVQGYIYLVAGSNDVESFNDFWRYDIQNNRWEQIQLIDKIPFGTTYKLFKYRDRLWLFNGSTKGIYRYFYNERQFILQPIYEELNDELKKLQQKNVFLEFPIQIQCMEEIDRLYIWSGKSASLNYLIIDLKDKRVIGSNFTNPVIPKNRIFWLTPAYYIVADTKTEAYLGYYNVSEFQGLTINEMPNPIYYGFNFNSDYGGCDGTSFYLRNPITRELNYFDNSGIFKVDEEWLQVEDFYQPDAYQSEIFVSYVNTIDRDSSFAYYDKTQQLAYIATKEALENYKNVYPTFRFLYKGAMFDDTYVKYAEVGKDKKYYIVPGGKYANVYRYSPATYSWFKYHTELWEGCVVAYDDDLNMLFAFGGILGTGKIPYDQNGIAYQIGGCNKNTGALGSAINLDEFNNYVQELGKQVKISLPVQAEGGGIAVHNGLMIYDLNYASMQVNYLKNLPENIVRLDYDEIKNYLIEYIANNNIVNLSEVDLDRIQQQFYTATQQIIDDLSKRDVYSENGIRPTPRAFASSYYDKKTKNWYILGGVHISVSCKGLCNPTYNYEHVYQDLWVFNTSTRTWKRLKNIPVPIHSASITMSPDRKYLIVIGGLRNKVETVNQIWLYHIETDSWYRLEGVPSGFTIGAKPSLYWLEDDKLMIGYSLFYTYQKSDDCPKNHVIPYKVSDSYWILDWNENILYKAFEALPASNLIMVDDVNNQLPTKLDILETKIQQKNKNGAILAYTKLYRHDITTGKYKVYRYYFLGDNGALSVQDITGSNESLLMNIIYAFRYKNGNIFALYNEQDGIRIYEFDETTRTAKVYVIDYPIPASAKLAIYDGKDYLYVIWNGYNIWRLDLTRAINNASGDYWLQLPPFPDLNDFRPEGGRILPNGQIVLYNSYGLIIRFNPETNAWFLESKIFPEYKQQGTKSNELVAVDKDEYALFYIEKGKVNGRYFDILYKQFDKFFFDARRLAPDIGDSQLLEEIEKQTKEATNLTDDVNEILGSILDDSSLPNEYKQELLESLSEQPNVEVPNFENLFETVQVRRSRFYTVNALGHLLYSWIRKYGHFKGEWKLNDFVYAEKLRIYADLKVLNAYNNDKTLFEVKIKDNTLQWNDLTNSGTVVINEIDWFYDERKGMYRKDNPDGSYILSKLPPNYIEFNLPTGKYFNQIYFSFKPEPKDYSYIARINKVELIATSDELVLKDINPVDEILIQPFNTSTSPEYVYSIQNTSMKNAYNVKVYIKDNNYVEFSLDGTNWQIGNIDNPFEVASEIPPNGEVTIHIRAKKINRPIKDDLVILGTFEI